MRRKNIEQVRPASLDGKLASWPCWQDQTPEYIETGEADSTPRVESHAGTEVSRVKWFQAVTLLHLGLRQ